MKHKIKKIARNATIGAITLCSLASANTNDIQQNKHHFLNSVKTLEKRVSILEQRITEQNIKDMHKYQQITKDFEKTLAKFSELYEPMQEVELRDETKKHLKGLSTKLSSLLKILEPQYAQESVQIVKKAKGTLLSRLYIIKSMVLRLLVPKKFRSDIQVAISQKDYDTKGMELRAMYLNVDDKFKV